MEPEERKTRLVRVRDLIRAGRHADAFSLLREVAAPEDDFVLQAKYASLFTSISRAGLELRPLRVAMLASSTVDHLNAALRYWLASAGFDATVYASEYDTVAQTILDPGSDLYRFDPDVVVIFSNYRDVRCEVRAGASQEDVERVVGAAVEETASLWAALRRQCRAHVLQNNADLPSHRVFGNFEGEVSWGRANVLRRFNLRLAERVPSGVTLFDLEALSSSYGKTRWHDNRYWHHSKHAFTPDATGLVAFEMARVIAAVKGQSKKCLVFDLDNTLWGGVIGDDGLDGIVLGHGPEGEAFVEFQRYLLALKDRGIILAVCSKNEDSNAREPFLKHPDMQITLSDVAVFRANWDNKADNIRDIAATLNIGLDSIVFVDDNPAETQLVRDLLPTVAVLDLPRDPADYIGALSRCSFFEVVTFSDEDLARGDYYRDNAARGDFQKTFSDLTEYLQRLEMVGTVGTFDALHLPRIAQLINKSNQFHVTTTRYSENEIRVMMADPSIFCRYVKLRDRFGDNGLVAALILKGQPDSRLYIDTWVMSCRVLQRGLEEFICREIVAIAEAHGCVSVIGRYVPTGKNRLVCRLYERLGFRLLEESGETTMWELAVGDGAPAYGTFVAAETAS